MLDLIYDLHPDENIAEVDGHLLILLLGSHSDADSLSDYISRRVERLDDASEFQIAIVESSDFVALTLKQMDVPILLHFADGRERSRHEGIDDCVEFFDEFVISNRCRKYGKNKKRTEL
jgi:hypothetical protein